MKEALHKIETLLEALPYIQKFKGKSIVIKYGGAAMNQADLRAQFAQDVVLLRLVGMHPVIVHGGGPQINQLLTDLQIPSEFVDGHRITDEASMEVVEMVLSGSVNKSIVSLINKAGGRAVGISGKDGHLARGILHELEKKTDSGTEKVSLGRVGTVDINKIDTSILTLLDDSGYIPIIAPVTVDSDGHSLNINADTMAGAIAAALQAEKLILLTDTPGVIHEGKTITGLKFDNVKALIENEVIHGGMLPKVDCCLHAIEHGVNRAHIIDGRVPHALLLEIFTDKGVGTLIES